MLMRRDAQLAPERLHIVPATSRDADAAAEVAPPEHVFLRGSWAEATAAGAVRRWAAVRGDGSLVAAIPLVPRRLGPLTVREVAGCYWPFRGVPVAADATAGELTAMLAGRGLKRALGHVWRLGPIFDNDSSAVRLREAAEATGWAVLVRRLGTCFEIDVAALQSGGAWPRGSTMRKNRWREKQLGDLGALDHGSFTGATWTAADRDAIAEVERNSWLAKLGTKAALQFADARQRAYWEQVAADPVIAPMLFGSVLRVGGTPAAFSFGLQVGTTRYQVANNFDERFAQNSAGRTLLIRDFAEAAASGVKRISWGSGDAGYKTQLGAEPGPGIIDLLFVRPRFIAPPLRRWWTGRISPPAPSGA